MNIKPSILLPGQKTKSFDLQNFKQECREIHLTLAYLWSTKRLLALFDGPPPVGHGCRVFNCFKSSVVDRQIEDRRSPDHAERRIRGPYHLLLTSLHVPTGCFAAGSKTDRKDLYHQARVSKARAHSNCLPFSYPRSLFRGLPALEELGICETSRKAARQAVGDRYEDVHKRHVETPLENGEVIPGFASLFQGDHLGVEFALSAHQTLLDTAGLLSEAQQVRGHAPFPLGPNYQCFTLVMQDFHVRCPIRFWYPFWSTTLLLNKFQKFLVIPKGLYWFLGIASKYVVPVGDVSEHMQKTNTEVQKCAFWWAFVLCRDTVVAPKTYFVRMLSEFNLLPCCNVQHTYFLFGT